MLSIEDTDKGSEGGSLNSSPISKSLRDTKIKNTRSTMKLALFGTPRAEKRETGDSPRETVKKHCGSWAPSMYSTKDQATWEKEETHFRIEKPNDRKPTEETLTPNMEDEHKKISVGLYNDKPNEAYYGNIVSLDSISCSQGSQGSLPDEINMKTSQNRKLKLDTSPPKDHTNPQYAEEDEEGLGSHADDEGSNLEEDSPGQYIPPIFSKGIDNQAEDMKEELQIEDGQSIYLIRGDFFSYYIEEEILGEGMSGTVKKCTKVGTEETFAVKMVRYRGDTELLYLIVKEFKNHKVLNHKNIIKVYELYIDYVKKTIYTVMELAECKEMFETIQDLGTYSEAVASEIFKQILSGINYLHLSGVCHRDLKPHNILVSNNAKIVKITDFNVSKFTEKKSKYSGLSTQNYKMWTHTGTIAFTAPEVFTDSEYTEAVDMWSAGVVLYTMLCGYQPFQSDNVHELIELIKEAKYEFHPDPWDNISSQAKDLIKRLLDVSLKTRFSPFQALTHPWIANQGKISKKCITGVIENLWSYLNKKDGKPDKTSSKASITMDSKGSLSDLSAPKLYDGHNKYKSSPPKKHLLGAFLSPMRNKLTSTEEKRFFYQTGINYSDELGLEKSLSFGLVEGQANFFKLSQIQKEMKKDDFNIFKDLKSTKVIPSLSKVCETIGEDNNEYLAENDNKDEQEEEQEPISCVRDSDDSF